MRQDQDRTVTWLARGLGVASLGLGLAEIIAPAGISRLCGIRRPVAARTILPLLGVRELGHAAGLLAARGPSRWVWTRVVGDAIDLSLLGRGLADGRGDRRRIAAATGAITAITALDVYAAIRVTRARGMRRGRRMLRLEASVTVKRTPEEVYRFWHNLENLPIFMSHLESVRMMGQRSSHWTARAPSGRTVEWDAEIIEDRPRELIAWRTVDGTNVQNSGSVRFVPAPGGRGTEIRVEMQFSPPGGRVGAAVAKMFGEHPYQQVRDDLRRFKQVIETGEVARSEGSPDGMSARRQVMQHSGQPRAAADR
jgi:uncharacterized membrane protein